MEKSLVIVLPELGLRVLQSFGAMMVILSFMTPQEQHHTQHICVWFYKLGTSRVQTRIRLRWQKYLFTNFLSGYLEHNIISITDVN